MAAKVLVIDDDVDYLETMRAALEAAGFVVATARDGRQGLALARRLRPDTIVLDVMMSWALDGLQVSLQLKDDPILREIPVLMVSAIGTSEYAAAFPADQPLHVEQFLTKPVTSAHLVSMVKKSIASRVSV
ncbi:MAG: response regulator [Chloroflexota bacterium]